MMDKTYSVEGNDPLHDKVYESFINSTTTGLGSDKLQRADSLIAPGFGGGNFTTNPYRIKALNMLGVKYIVNRNDSLSDSFTPETQTFPTDSYHLIFQEKPFQVYENLDVANRYFLTNSYKIIKEEDFFKSFYDTSFD